MVPVPITRSKAIMEQSTVADATQPVLTEAVTAPLTGALVNLDESSTVHGRDAKELKEATTEALINVWKDVKKGTAQLAEQVNQGNSNLLDGLNGSFAAFDAY
ncbi:unnamed protein product [Cylicostephanus goldi]|uniref:Uncharacterized protein n=1 Tax=Cylicostephanus goldi TaxID=71465 RepID=A0A3P7N491_CYLGO|nr:unnamed protein product [Cylicostephanus goldi]